MISYECSRAEVLFKERGGRQGGYERQWRMREQRYRLRLTCHHYAHMEPKRRRSFPRGYICVSAGLEAKEMYLVLI